ncbi:LysM peptidoglycan-binding domain-containing protein [Roseobacter weihaiensis]|uniref:LysM peptidoglycan-binding domain-containing protein n=1 Tax=Roseobacter weihaiensis TaxID=2763262 RepID=UPI001D0A9591|nr:LysM peptidoglycan-binding domain-containing protein [Roseobacter sp. H9]
MMSDKGAAPASGGTGLLAAGIVIAVVIAAGIYMGLRDDAQPDQQDLTALVAPSEQGAGQTASPTADPAPPEATAAPAASETAPAEEESTEQAAPTEGSSESAAPETVAATTSPTIDEVRVDDAGVAVIAGRAAPGSQVDILVDGDVVATVEADDSGAFATVGTVSGDSQARVLSLRATEEGGAVGLSEEDVILAPVIPAAEPAALADAPAETPDVLANVAPTPGVEPSDETTAAIVPETEEAPAPGVVEDAAVPATQQADASSSGAEDASSAETASSGSQIAVLRSNEEGVSLLQSTPVPAGSVVLDTIGYSEDGAVQLSGRASVGAVEVRAYLDNRAVARLPVGADGTWRGDVTGIEAGVYTLRVDALAADGSVTSRIETPFKREAPAALAAATDGRTGPVTAVTVQAGDTLWAIARDRYGEGPLFVRVFEANRSAIRDPDLIYPGQVFDLPGD